MAGETAIIEKSKHPCVNAHYHSHLLHISCVASESDNGMLNFHRRDETSLRGRSPLNNRVAWANLWVAAAAMWILPTKDCDRVVSKETGLWMHSQLGSQHLRHGSTALVVVQRYTICDVGFETAWVS